VNASTKSIFVGSQVVLKTFDAVARAVRDEEAPFGASGEGINAVETARPCSAHSEFADILHVAIEDHHAVIIQAIGDEYPSVGKKCHILRRAEVSAVGALHALLTVRLNQVAAIVGEDIDDTVAFVHHPDPMPGIVRIDANTVPSRTGRIREEAIPLRPAFSHVAISVEGNRGSSCSRRGDPSRGAH
jgi:hypothetical protein